MLEIVRYSDLLTTAGQASIGQDRLTAGLDGIFFEASNTQSFASDDARAAFRQRWLGRYLETDPQLAFVAIDDGARVAGYIAGALDDPALSGRFSDIWYFAPFSDLTRRYPTHLHVNLGPRYRGKGLGSSLVAHFVAEAGRAGAPGVHVVTAAGARNIAFYARNGFREAGQAERGGARVVFLARDLTQR